MHLIDLNGILAQANCAATGPAAAGGGSLWQPHHPVGFDGGHDVFYPDPSAAAEARQALAALVNSLKSGDKVVTAGGIIGIVITVKDKTVSLRSADTKMEVTKASVTEILEGGNAAPKPKPS